jgi:hypothetical protein
MYYCYHLVVKEGSYIRHGYGGGLDQVERTWRDAGIGQHLIMLEDIKDLSEVIVSLIEVNEGADKEEVAKSWNGSTEMVVRNAIKDLEQKNKAFDNASAVMRL